MTTILNERSDAAVNGNDSWGAQWTPDPGIDMIDGARSRPLAQGPKATGSTLHHRTTPNRPQQTERSICLDERLRSEDQFEGIIGRSVLLQETFDQIRIV